MTFEEWFGSNRYLLKSEGKDRQIFTAEDLEDAWNAAIEASLLAAASAPAAPMGMSVLEQVEGQIKKLLTA